MTFLERLEHEDRDPAERDRARAEALLRRQLGDRPLVPVFGWRPVSVSGRLQIQGAPTRQGGPVPAPPPTPRLPLEADARLPLPTCAGLARGEPWRAFEALQPQPYAAPARGRLPRDYDPHAVRFAPPAPAALPDPRVLGARSTRLERRAQTAQPPSPSGAAMPP